mmetsp:Transcript_24055/g.60846  ORF Transcript_24055/g.60846 Transcript_24055/m.60846 type:complete len:205 (+) Transcript_24055:271-885(+)
MRHTPGTQSCAKHFFAGVFVGSQFSHTFEPKLDHTHAQLTKHPSLQRALPEPARTRVALPFHCSDSRLNGILMSCRLEPLNFGLKGNRASFRRPRLGSCPRSFAIAHGVASIELDPLSFASAHGAAVRGAARRELDLEFLHSISQFGTRNVRHSKFGVQGKQFSLRSANVLAVCLSVLVELANELHIDALQLLLREELAAQLRL